MIVMLYHQFNQVSAYSEGRKQNDKNKRKLWFDFNTLKYFFYLPRHLLGGLFW